MDTWSINDLNYEVALSLHYYWPSWSPTLITMSIPSIEGVVPVGYSYVARKISSDVKFDGAWAVQLGHDVGFLIPHVTVPPDNLWALKVMALSKCKVTFARSTVFVNTHPAGAWYPELEPLLVCGEPVDLPMGRLVDAQLRNTVTFTLTMDDLWRGRLYTNFEILLSFALGKLTDQIGGRWVGARLAPRLSALLGQRILAQLGVTSAMLDKLLAKAYGSAIKKGAGSLLSRGSREVGAEGFGDLIYALGLPDVPPPPSPTSAITNSRPRVGH